MLVEGGAQGHEVGEYEGEVARDEGERERARCVSEDQILKSRKRYRYTTNMTGGIFSLFPYTHSPRPSKE